MHWSQTPKGRKRLAAILAERRRRDEERAEHEEAAETPAHKAVKAQLKANREAMAVALTIRTWDDLRALCRMLGREQ